MVDLEKMDVEYNKKPMTNFVPIKQSSGASSQFVGAAERLMAGEFMVLPVKYSGDGKMAEDSAATLRHVGRALTRRGYKLLQAGDKPVKPTRIQLSARMMTPDEVAKRDGMVLTAAGKQARPDVVPLGGTGQ